MGFCRPWGNFRSRKFYFYDRLLSARLWPIGKGNVFVLGNVGDAFNVIIVLLSASTVAS